MPHAPLPGTALPLRVPRALGALLGLLLLGACVTTPAVPAAAPARVERLAAACNGCHGPGGRGSEAMPSLRARSPEWIATRLETWRSSATPDGRDHVMVRFARALSAEDVAELAEHYGRSGLNVPADTLGEGP
ncbi:MAG: c-type cytochrome [Pseudomonadales bacterium]|jgi:cytochrome c553|nr:c-type cytochrome [Pseudomonadales bacterium]